MKIGILTLPFNNNYGGFLQAYALKIILEKNEHDVWFIDLQNLPERGLKYFVKKIIKKYLFREKNIFILPSKELDYYRLYKIITWQNTQLFVDKYLCPKISPIYFSKDLSYLINFCKFDAFIAGSDQIWRPKYMSKFLKTAYFDFLKGRGEKRLIYAASFGTDECEYPRKLKQECAKLAKKIDAISVREVSGINLCIDYWGLDAVNVLDPTMLLDKEDYIKLIEKAGIEKSEGDLFCYILDPSEEKNTCIKKFLTHNTLKPFFMSLKKEESKIENRILEPVEKWLRGFYDAKFVITDSFHGLAFSIIFNKPFFCFANNERGNDRLVSLLKMFGVERKLVVSIDKFKNYELNDINWDEINKTLANNKEKSFSFLRQALL
jgi:hypothetical protein